MKTDNLIYCSFIAGWLIRPLLANLATWELIAVFFTVAIAADLLGAWVDRRRGRAP